MPASFIELRGKTALVTGAAKRLGRATALALAREGVHCILHYRSSREACEAVAQEVRKRGVNAWNLQADLAEGEGACRELVAQALDTAKALDILVNNASIFDESSFGACSGDEVAENIDVNALAPFFLGRAFARQAVGGDIINFLDTMIADYDRKHVAYHLSKRMLYTLTRMMAVELAPAFRVNGVAPGLVLPPEGKDVDYLESLKESNPLCAYGDESAISETVVFLLRNTFVTGQVIYVDGGRHLRGSMYG